MDEQNQKPIRVTAAVSKSKNHVTFTANRIHGSMQPGDLIQIDFLLQTKELSPENNVVIKSDGFMSMASKCKYDEVGLENMATAILSLPMFIQFYQWMNEKVEEMEKNGIISRISTVEIDKEE